MQAHLRRLLRSGALRDGGREVDLAAIGYDVVAFVTLEVTHRELDGVIAALRKQPAVLEVYEISGRGDVWCRIAARDVPSLHVALRSVLRIRGVIRSETSLALHDTFPTGPAAVRARPGQRARSRTDCLGRPCADTGGKG